MPRFKGRVAPRKERLIDPRQAVYYYKVEHPECRLVPIQLPELRGILYGLGYLLDEVKGYRPL